MPDDDSIACFDEAFRIPLQLRIEEMSTGKEIVPRHPENGRGFAIVDKERKIYGIAELIDETYLATLGNPVGMNPPSTAYDNEAARIIYEAMEGRHNALL